MWVTNLNHFNTKKGLIILKYSTAFLPKSLEIYSLVPVIIVQNLRKILHWPAVMYLERPTWMLFLRRNHNYLD